MICANTPEHQKSFRNLRTETPLLTETDQTVQ